MAEEGGGGNGGGLGGSVGTTTPMSLVATEDASSGLGECTMLPTAHNNSSGGGRLYPCPDCEKVFRHPRSYYQHQHVHRGTHSCPGCGKLFSRRWDLLRHLNKNKYGCPARWREGSRHPPYHNSLSLSALASAAAVAASSQENLVVVPPEPPPPPLLPSDSQPVHHHHQSVPWTIPTITTTVGEGGGGSRSRRSSSSSGSNREPRPPESPVASRTSP